MQVNFQFTDRYSGKIEREVVVAGSGIAAAAVACRLMEFGYSVSLLSTSAPGTKGVEILPPETWVQVTALGWESVFGDAGVVRVEGFRKSLERGRARD